MSALSFEQLVALAGNRRRADAPCPLCGPDRRAPGNKRRKVLRIYAGANGFYSYNCARCGARGYAHTDRAVRSHCRGREKIQREAEQNEQNDDDTKRTEQALKIWHAARHPHGTIVEIYLARRGLEMPAHAAGEAIRYHPRCPFKSQRTPAMVALVRDVVTNEPKAIHRTALTTDGRKDEIDGDSRLSLGLVGGGALKLTADENVTLCLGIGEGIESALSLRLAVEFGPSPVWALLSAGQLEQFPVLAGIEALWIAVDHDEAGIKAARECAARWRKAGREAFLVRPRAERADLNDLVKVV